MKQPSTLKGCQTSLIIGSSVLFALLTTFLAGRNDVFWFALVPLALILALVLFLEPKSFWYLIIICTPFSLSFEETALGGIGFYLPTEPMLLIFLGLMMYQLLINPKMVPRGVWQHPISLILIVQVLWIGITSLTSILPLVSIKFLISRLWFIVPIYLGGCLILTDASSNKKFLKSYFWPFFIVALYTLIRHWALNFEERPSHWVMRPFLKDHTQLGAVYGLILPVAFYLAAFSKRLTSKVLYYLIALLFCFGLYYTYSRAALLTVVISAMVFLIMKLKLSFRTVAIVGFTVGLIAFFSFSSIIQNLEKNDTDSSNNFVDNIESTTNITTDASNVERINRWLCAIDMAKERPLLGWGPGVYKFQYAPFQRSSLQTIISTNEGQVGNAHSEYLGPLAETGVIGMLITMILFVLILYTGIHTYSTTNDKENKAILMCCIIGLVSYMAHGFLNNFLDTDKASILFWGYTAIIVGYHINQKKEQSNSKSSIGTSHTDPSS